jgi:hypothetical protein
MILLYNVYLTDTPGNSNVFLDRGLLPIYSKLDIAKYSLCSLASAYEWTKVIINIELDPNIFSEEEISSLPKFINDTFKNIEVLFSPIRVKYQKDWKNIYKEIDSDFILLLCNHDHIFLDSNNNCLKNIIVEAKKQHSKYVTIAMSHWPENIRWAKSGYIQLDANNPTKYNKNYKINNYGLSYEGISLDSLNIISKELYYEWFFIGDWPNIELVRIDGVAQKYPDLIQIKDCVGKTIPEQLIIIPYKEQMRHFDGYMHQRIDNNTCPSLNIPDGFFESKIKIRYGYDDYKDGWVNINPKKDNYRAYSLDGTDDKITLEDIPLFWKDRVSEIDINQKINDEEMIQYRLQSVLKTIYSDTRYSNYIDNETQINVLNSYLRTYKQYELNETE